MYLSLLDFSDHSALCYLMSIIYVYLFTDREKNIHNRQQLEGQLTESNLVKTVTFFSLFFL